MNRPVRTGTDSDEARARILEVAEEHFRRIGYHKTSVADIASELGMSPANVYRFFPSRDAINESICGRALNEVADIALAIARANAPAMEKLDRLLTAVYRHNKTKLVEEKHMHDLIVAAMQDNWAIIRTHTERMVTILEAIKSAFMPFFHPILIEHCVRHGEDSEAGLRDQIRFVLKALGRSD